MHTTFHAPRRKALGSLVATSVSPTMSIPPSLRWTYLTLYSLSRSRPTSQTRAYTSTSKCLNSGSSFNRSDFSSQPFTGTYTPHEQTTGPLGNSSLIGAPRITPKMLKEHLDQFVVGQERAKKVLSTAVYNHYQRIQEIQRQDEEMAELRAQWERRALGGVKRHPVEGRDSPSQHHHHSSQHASTSASHSYPHSPEHSSQSFASADASRSSASASASANAFQRDHQHNIISEKREEELTLESDEFPGQTSTIHVHSPNYTPPPPPPPPLQDYTPLTIEKSNVLLLGPSGVGKTLMAKTLARVLEVPFSMSDCTPLTQAGYIGEDVEVVIQRLLAASNYDVARAEQGIVCLDEIDKIATAKVSHGKDVSGEGVQQALLKIIEGTTVQVQAKTERGAPGSRNAHPPPGWNPASPGSSGTPPPSSSSGGPGGKGEVYNVRTDNILFICTGAFVGLHKTILDRISRGSIGFGASVRSSTALDSASTSSPNTKESEALFKKHLPFFTPAIPSDASADAQPEYNILDLLEPADLQKYGLIPELVGRIPISCALSSLSEEALVRVLTEPRNALLKQYEQLFSLSGIELRFTSPALRQVAKDASTMGTGARGLKTVLERLLGEAMFETPGSGTKHVLVTGEVARRESGPVYLGRGERGTFHGLIAREEEEWERRGKEEGGGFREFREKAIAAGSY